MEQGQTDLLPHNLLQENSIPRNKLIPAWIKIFSWVFIVFGILAPVALIVGILGYEFQLSLYGLETRQPLSVEGLIIVILFMLKGIVAFGILTKKDWTVKLALVDAAIGILLCVYMMVFVRFMIRLELLAIIPYLVKMRKIKTNWEMALK